MNNISSYSITVTLHDAHGISDQRQFDYLFIGLFK